ncbi:glutathionylspermidine synthase family protein [Mariniluteicoccus endophyticus]
MRRHADVPVRAHWQQRILANGLIYSPTQTPDGNVIQYWREGAAYSFTMADIDALAEAASTIFEMCVEAGDAMAADRRILRRMGIPLWAHDTVLRSWDDTIDGQEFGSVYGRFDFRFGGLDHPDPALRTPQLYEFNADTPTCLLESAWIQWQWLQDSAYGPDQWNLLWERLVEAWKRNLALVERRIGRRPKVWFAFTEDEQSGEDAMNTLYLQDTCHAAGYKTDSLWIEEIVLGDDGMFYNADGSEHLDVVFKLYPWEWMVAEEFGHPCLADLYRQPKTDAQGRMSHGTVWIEPPYKMLWSNKGVLPVLWDLFADDPRSKYLIPSWFEGFQPADLGDHVRKPLLGREGANVTIVRDGERIEDHGGEYGEEGFVIQAYAPLPAFTVPDSDLPVHPMIGVWMVDGEPSGLGVRESTTLVTDNQSHFVPHVISDAPDRKAPVEPEGILTQATLPDQFRGWPTLPDRRPSSEPTP